MKGIFFFFRSRNLSDVKVYVVEDDLNLLSRRLETMTSNILRLIFSVSNHWWVLVREVI